MKLLTVLFIVKFKLALIYFIKLLESYVLDDT